MPRDPEAKYPLFVDDELTCVCGQKSWRLLTGPAIGTMALCSVCGLKYHLADEEMPDDYE